jgi:hypothetical protein
MHLTAATNRLTTTVLLEQRRVARDTHQCHPAGFHHPFRCLRATATGARARVCRLFREVLCRFLSCPGTHYTCTYTVSSIYVCTLSSYPIVELRSVREDDRSTVGLQNFYCHTDSQASQRSLFVVQLASQSRIFRGFVSGERRRPS